MSRHTIIAKSNLKPKFFSQISDHQQSMSLGSFRGAFLILPALLVVADSLLSQQAAGNLHQKRLKGQTHENTKSK
jgi:hypothetical protein